MFEVRTEGNKSSSPWREVQAKCSMNSKIPKWEWTWPSEYVGVASPKLELTKAQGTSARALRQVTWKSLEGAEGKRDRMQVSMFHGQMLGGTRSFRGEVESQDSSTIQPAVMAAGQRRWWRWRGGARETAYQPTALLVWLGDAGGRDIKNNCRAHGLAPQKDRY